MNVWILAFNYFFYQKSIGSHKPEQPSPLPLLTQENQEIKLCVFALHLCAIYISSSCPPPKVDRRRLHPEGLWDTTEVKKGSHPYLRFSETSKLRRGPWGKATYVEAQVSRINFEDNMTAYRYSATACQQALSNKRGRVAVV